MITPARYPSGWESGCGPADPRLSNINTTSPAGTGYGVVGTGEVGTINAGLNTPVTQPAVPIQVRALKGSDGNLYFRDNDGNLYMASGIVDAPSDGQFYSRQNGSWLVTPARNWARYIRQRYCDSPLGTQDVQAGAGGGAILTGIDASLMGLGHVGVWKPTTGTANSSYMSICSSTIGPEFGLSNADKLGFRLVFKTLSPIPSGVVGAATYAEFVFGWTNTLHTLPLPAHRRIAWRFALNTSPNWIFNTSDGATMNTVPSTVPVAANTWYDARIYWDANGVVGKIGPYGGPLFSTGVVIANVPSGSMFWELLPMSGASGTTSYAFYTALYEVIAEAIGMPMLLGDQLVTNF